MGLSTALLKERESPSELDRKKCFSSSGKGYFLPAKRASFSSFSSGTHRS